MSICENPSSKNDFPWQSCSVVVFSKFEIGLFEINGKNTWTKIVLMPSKRYSASVQMKR